MIKNIIKKISISDIFGFKGVNEMHVQYIMINMQEQDSSMFFIHTSSVSTVSWSEV